MLLNNINTQNQILLKLYFYQNVIPVLGSDVIYSEGAVLDLLSTLRQLCGGETTIFLAGELRNGNNCLLYYLNVLFL